MGLVKTATDYNGQVANSIYKDFAESNEVVQKGIARLELRVRDSIELGALRQSDNPLGTYVATPNHATKGDETATSTYNKRTLTLSKAMLLQYFTPDDWLDFWDKWGAQGSFTDLRMNPAFMEDLLALLSTKVGSQISKNFFQGDTAGAAGLNLADGLIKKAAADANVIDAVTNGALTTATILVALQNVIDAIPDKEYDNEDYKILVSTADWRIIQRANSNAKVANDGFLNDTVKDMIEQKRIIPFVGMKKDYMIATKTGTDEFSNLVLAFWFDEDEEQRDLQIEKIAPLSKEWAMRMDIKLGFDYVYSENVVLYSPA